MIIKSLSRKNGSYRSFQQLYDYITRDDGCDQRFNFTHNFFADDRDSILKEFTRNAGFIPKRQNGNYLYHEILSFTRSSQLSETQQLEIIRKVAIRYVQERARGCLGFGGVHTDKDNQLHVHLILSANQIDQTKKHSLSKDAYKQVRRNSEAHVLEKYPEMEQEKLINQTVAEKQAKKLNRNEARDLFTERVRAIMEQVNSDQEFKELLEIHDIAYKYTRVNIVLTNPETGLPHRIKTINLQDTYDAMIERGKNAEFTQSQQEEKQHSQEQQSEQQSKTQQSRRGRKL
ncbi:MAG: relaxase/mobilization nuclease domain-containing protein [Arenicella sp.]